jgi:predicted HTH domain antitoxin
MNFTLSVPDTLPDALQVSSSQFATLAKQAMAVKLFEAGKLSTGQAAQLCDQSRAEFLLALPQWGVAQIRYPADELAADLANA